MSFIAPGMLWVLLALPAALLAYVHAQYRTRRRFAQYPGLGLARLAAAQRWRRHLPCGLFTLALAATGIALARPTAVIALPTMFDTVVLAIDVSGSMRATDIEPSRLAAIPPEVARTASQILWTGAPSAE